MSEIWVLTADSYDALVRGLSDINYLVRGYAAYGIACVGKSLNKKMHARPYRTYFTMRRFLIREQPFRRHHICSDRRALYRIFWILFCNGCLVQCFVLNGLKKLLSTKNKKSITAFICRLDPSQLCGAVVNSLNDLKNMLLLCQCIPDTDKAK